jgi:hypothetical protein
VPVQGREGFGRERKNGEEKGKALFRSLERSKALKGEAQERGELKEASRGGKS